VELVTYPLFAAQSRFILQPTSRTFRTYNSFPDFLRRAKFDAWRGCFGIIPRQIILTTWMALMPRLDAYTDAQFGMGMSNNGIWSLLKEIGMGMVGYTVVYPLITAARRVAV
jgi:hypothetical protein